MSDFPTLETERLRLREIIPEDSPTLLAIHGDGEAMRWFGTDPITDLAQADRLIEAFAGWRQLPNPGTRWGIQKKTHPRLIGSCGLSKWNRGWKSCMIGYELAHGAWGAGLMQESLSAVLSWGFQHMQLNRVEAQVHPENGRSLRLLHRLGFEQEGRLREGGYWLGEHHDLLQLALLRRDHLAKKTFCPGRT